MQEKKRPPVSHRRGFGPDRNITANTPLTVAEQKFLTNYIRLGNIPDAVIATKELYPETRTRNGCACVGQRLLAQANVKAELNRIMNELKTETLATAEEVMKYFTRVMRGEEKDQFGLEAPLSERTKAAQELARRTIDIENRKNGTPDQKIEIKLDWSRE